MLLRLPKLMGSNGFQLHGLNSVPSKDSSASPQSVVASPFPTTKAPSFGIIVNAPSVFTATEMVACQTLWGRVSYHLLLTIVLLTFESVT
jgi:hypothetical protein